MARKGGRGRQGCEGFSSIAEHDHLENRLEIANIERLDAEEQLFNLQTQKSPFDFKLQDLRVPSPLNHDHAKVGYIIPRQMNGLKRWETLQANEYVSLHNKS
jgi:hypothetical protein